MPSFISIIIPTYNSYGFMSDTLKSLENQTDKDFEVIFADDRSTDETYLRLFEYSARTELTVRVYQNETNGGPGRARNLGLSKAIGEYVTFMDSDDTVSNDFVEILKKTAAERKPDCILFDCNKCRKGKISPMYALGGREEGAADTADALVYSSTSVWGKMFRRGMLLSSEINFPEIFRLEDFCFVKKAIAASEKIFYLKKSLYNYIIRDGSIMNCNAFENERNSEIVFESIKESFGEKYHEETEMLFMLLRMYSASLGKACLGKSKREIKEYLKSLDGIFPEREKNKYLNGFPLYMRRVIRACEKKNASVIKFYAWLKKIRN